MSNAGCLPGKAGGFPDYAKARGANVSTVVTEAIEREVRLAALDRALAEADDRFGPVAEELVVRAEAKLAAATKRS